MCKVVLNPSIKGPQDKSEFFYTKFTFILTKILEDLFKSSISAVVGTTVQLLQPMFAWYRTL